MRHFPLIGSTSNLPLFSSLTSPVDIKFVKKYLELISITLPIKRLVVNPIVASKSVRLSS